MTNKRFTVNPLYKKLMLLMLVFGPFFWLVFTDDGQRRTDMVMTALLKGTEDMDIAFAKLQGAVIEDDFRASFPEVPFHCEERQSNFGDRLCSSAIASFNGVPARYAKIFFRDGHLSVVKIGFQPAHQAFLHRQLRGELGAPAAVDAQAGGPGVYRWVTEHGVVLARLGDDLRLEDADVLWLSNRYMATQSTTQ
jgi:hypothetical protein